MAAVWAAAASEGPLAQEGFQLHSSPDQHHWQIVTKEEGAAYDLCPRPAPLHALNLLPPFPRAQFMYANKRQVKSHLHEHEEAVLLKKIARLRRK